MGVFSDDNNVITCIYNSEDYTDKQTLAYVKASEKSLRAIDISKQELTGTQWVELAERLKTPLCDLINDENIEGDRSSFNENDCITILSKNPNALNGAIVFTSEKAKQIKNPSSVLEFIESDTNAIQKN